MNRPGYSIHATVETEPLTDRVKQIIREHRAALDALMDWGRHEGLDPHDPLLNDDHVFERTLARLKAEINRV